MVNYCTSFDYTPTDAEQLLFSCSFEAQNFAFSLILDHRNYPS